jgi:hypothetical protein
MLFEITGLVPPYAGVQGGGAPSQGSGARTAHLLAEEHSPLDPQSCLVSYF